MLDIESETEIWSDWIVAKERSDITSQLIGCVETYLQGDGRCSM